MPRRLKNRDTELSVVTSPRSSRKAATVSASVASGRLATKARNQSEWASSGEYTSFLPGFSAKLPVSSKRFDHLIAEETATLKRRAAALRDIPSPINAITRPRKSRE